MKLKNLYLWLFILAALTPFGLLASGSAWGEWAPGEVRQQIGFIPKGMKFLGSLWHGFLAGYNLPGFNGRFLGGVGYIVSAWVGIGLIFLIFKLVALVLPDEQEKGDTESVT